MTTTTYKGYTIRVVGISHYIFRPGSGQSQGKMSDGFEMSRAASERWINDDILERKLERQYALFYMQETS